MRSEARVRAGAQTVAARASLVLPVVLALLLLGAMTAPGPAPAQGAVVAPRAAGAPPAPPDVIVIMTDDQRLGTEKGMPYLWDKVRPEMTHYPNAVVPTNSCCPSRSAFLSGQYSHTTGVWDNTWARPGGASGGWRQFFRSGYEDKTIAVALQARGYHTALLGKYMNQYHTFRNDRPGNPPGWSDFRTYTHSNGGYWAPPLPIAGIPAGYTTDTLGDAAVQAIAATPKTTPLFLMYTPYAPHAPSTAGPYRGAADRAGALERMRTAGGWTNPSVGEADRSDKPKWNRKLPPLARDDGPGSPFPKVRNVTSRQADTLMGVDANIRKIVEQQQAVRDWDNTMVVFMSDNGIAWGDHVTFGKGTPYRLVNGIPLLIKYPAVVGWDRRTDRRLINQLDVTATIASLASAPLPTKGRSAVLPPTRSGLGLESPTTRARDEHWHRSYCAWRTRKALYVRYGDGAQELYDYTDDPFELTNQARNPDYRDLKSRMSVLAALACRPRPPHHRLPRPNVVAKGAEQRTKLFVDVNPDLIEGRQWRLTVQFRREGRWRPTNWTTSTRGRLRLRTLDLGKGTYRVVVSPGHGFGEAASRAVRLVG